MRLGAEGIGMLHDVLRLAGAEAQERIKELGTLLVLVAAGTAILIVALAAVAASAIAALGEVMPLWAAALIVAGLGLALVAGLGSLAVQRLRALGRPAEHTLRALEEGTEWLRLRSNS